MEFKSYIIDSLEQIVPEVFVFKLTPQDGSLLPFVAGQFCKIANPTSEYPDESRSFSLASTPNTKGYLEFCIKRYGPFTQALTSKKVGDSLNVAGPFGHFTWDDAIENVVYLAGGIGIVPLISQMRALREAGKKPKLVLVYGNRDEASIAFRKELESWFAEQPQCKLVHVLSQLPAESTWQGYRGFITKELLQEELDLTKDSTYFLCGPPVFVQLMNEILKDLGVDSKKVRLEIYASPPPRRQV